MVPLRIPFGTRLRDLFLERPYEPVIVDELPEPEHDPLVHDTALEAMHSVRPPPEED